MLADLPVEAPLDALAPEKPRAGSGAGAPSPARAPEAAHVPAEEFIDPEKILLASEHLPALRPADMAAASTSTAAVAAADAVHVANRLSAPPSIPHTASPPALLSAESSLATPAPAPSPPGALPTAAGAAQQAQRGPELMDRDFIARNQVVERYLSGRLPIKGATDFERFCRDHPELLDELGIPDRVNAALRLLEASGKPEPWAQPKKPFWQKLEIVLGLGCATLALGLALAIVAGGSADKTRRIAALQQEATERPLDPATSTRDIRLLPSREGASNSPAIIIGGGSEAQLADFRIDESRSPNRLFRITIDRINQGRVAIIDHLAKDSDGNLSIALNSTALGPGDYQLTIEGLNWQGTPQPDSWVTIGVRAPE